MKSAWNKRAKELSILRVVSISGGLRDALVPDELTDDTDLIHFSTAGIDGVEVEADHLCIVWCNQLVRFATFISSNIEWAGHFRLSRLRIGHLAVLRLIISVFVKLTVLT